MTKVGGNTKHSGSMLLSESDVKKKYMPCVANLFKEELAKGVKEDITK